MPQQPAVTLTSEERLTLESFVHRGKANTRTLTRARILLKSADGWSTAELAEAFDVCEATVTNVRGRFAQGGLEAVLHDQVQQRPRSGLSGLRRSRLIPYLRARGRSASEPDVCCPPRSHLRHALLAPEGNG